MRSSRTSAPGLKHLAFFEALAESEESSSAYRAATAGLLTMRLVDHWVLAGPVMVEPESVSVKSVREAIMMIAANDPQREVLLGLVNAMQTLREVNLQPLLPRIYAYADTLERRGVLALAADAYESVIRFAEEEYDGTLIIDSYMRLGFCRRMLGVLTAADTAFATAGRIAKRRREPERVLRSDIGRANVMMMRGNLPKADEMLAAACRASAESGFAAEQAMALHMRAVVAQRRGRANDAVCMAYEALQLTEVPTERDRVLADIAAFFILLERYDAARDALLILDATAQTDNVRANARVNMVALASRTGDRALFTRARDLVERMTLPVEFEVNYWIESARGFSRFGEEEGANELLEKAKALAERHGLNRSVFEAEELLAKRGAIVSRATSGEIPYEQDPAAHVAQELHQMAAQLPA
jgi:tetratricopeptide (TPR) repeat protein